MWLSDYVSAKRSHKLFSIFLFSGNSSMILSETKSERWFYKDERWVHLNGAKQYVLATGGGS